MRLCNHELKEALVLEILGKLENFVTRLLDCLYESLFKSNCLFTLAVLPVPGSTSYSCPSVKSILMVLSVVWVVTVQWSPSCSMVMSGLLAAIAVLMSASTSENGRKYCISTLTFKVFGVFGFLSFRFLGVWALSFWTFLLLAWVLVFSALEIF